MSPPRFTHKRITADEFNAELARQNLVLPAFTRIWCQNLTTTTRWANGERDIPTWVPIALTVMGTRMGNIAARQAAAAMIEKDNLNPQWGDFPYLRAREMPEDDDNDPGHMRGDGENIEWLTSEKHREKHRRPGYD